MLDAGLKPVTSSLQVLYPTELTDGCTANHHTRIFLCLNKCVCVCVLMIFFFFLIWVLCPFQEYFTYIKPIVHQRWAKIGVPGEKPPDHP